MVKRDPHREESPHTYECMDCGERIKAESHPGECRECSGDLWNLSRSSER
jgi:Zn finger protein HypA/HybF involved in hydrogenase expression